MRRALWIWLVLVLAVAIPLGVFRYLTAIDRSFPSSARTVIVPSGASGREVAQLLATSGVIGNAWTFELLARLHGDERTMHAGEFAFDAHDTQREILRQLVEGGRQVALWVTIPEGFTAKEIAQTLAAHDLGEADALLAYFLSTSIALDGTRTVNLEGYLFPDTYLVPKSASPAQIADIMTGRLRAEIPANATSLAARLHMTVPQVVTVASLVEREAKVDAERPLMAGVYYNRLRLGMPLQVDATLEYAFAHHKDVITYADLARDTPYNSYLHPGLPPTPIANPGEPSLHAAFFPEASKFLYYVAMGNGRHAFSRTLAEHDANVARYLH